MTFMVLRANGQAASRVTGLRRWVMGVLWAGAGALLMLAACAPSPRSIPCSNGGDCEKVDPKFAYCLEGRCVECVTNTSCGDGNTCVDGACVTSCKDGRDCPEGQACSDGKCDPK